MENEQIDKVEGKTAYIMVPRKLIVAWISTTVVLFIIIVASFQYTNYVDRKSKGLWCGIITLIDDRNRSNPNPPPESVEFYAKFHELRKRLNCT